MNLKLSIIGAGYVGLVASACFTEAGNEVLCVEKDQSKIDSINAGNIPIYEPGLEELVAKGIKSKKLRFSNNLEEAVKFSDVIFLCLGTPQEASGKADLSQVEEVSSKIAELIDGYKLIVEKSTVPVGTHQLIKKNIERYSKGSVSYDVASNPEFLREGFAVQDFMNPVRIVVGVESERAKQLFQELYKPFTDKGNLLLVTDPTTSELIKYACNAFLATKISFINLIAELCDKVGANVEQVAEAMGYDSRIGKEFLKAGIGYGGSCLPKDVNAFIKTYESHDLDNNFLKEVYKTNDRSRKRFVEKIEEVLWINKNKKVAIWGLAFKPNTDDIREAPSIDIVKKLLDCGAHLSLYDPKAMCSFKRLFPEKENLKYNEDVYAAAAEADALVIVTDWQEFKEVDLEKLKSVMKLPIILDARNLFEPAKIKALGFEYYSLGRP
ncbi:MAG: UDP-glucose/GDP-mannose dehydrogenase family protein [Candidatus Caenarcaniphilales bacterium]|nr:UDP-glucose/GDP-mannose dehydrogenase family protein [Candidatus Caenarcaniphilales bacterium]